MEEGRERNPPVWRAVRRGVEGRVKLTERSMAVRAESAALAAAWSERQDAAAEQASSRSRRPSTSTRSASGSLSTSPPPPPLSAVPEGSPLQPAPSPSPAVRGFFSAVSSSSIPLASEPGRLQRGLWIAGSAQICCRERRNKNGKRGEVTEEEGYPADTQGPHEHGVGMLPPGLGENRVYDIWALPTDTDGAMS